MTQSPLLDVRNLSITVGSGVQAVRGVTFTVKPGEVLGIVGESGCGKSVLVCGMLGLLSKGANPHLSGEALFNGKDLLTASTEELRLLRRNKIGIIFQDPMTSLNPTLSIGRQIAEAAPLSRDEAAAKTVELLRLVGIPDASLRQHQYPHQFSGGMRQRVMIAMALACDPELLIADEPTTALDVTIQAQILDLLKTIQQERGTSMILITHDLGIVAHSCDRVAVMYAGQIMELAPVDTLFAQPRHPYTQALLKVKEAMIPIEGAPPDLSCPPQGCPFAARCPEAMDICRERPPEPLSPACWLDTARSP